MTPRDRRLKWGLEEHYLQNTTNIPYHHGNYPPMSIILTLHELFKPAEKLHAYRREFGPLSY